MGVSAGLAATYVHARAVEHGCASTGPVDASRNSLATVYRRLQREYRLAEDEKYGRSGRHFDRVGRLVCLCVDLGSVAEGREREGQTSRALERVVYTAQLTRRSLPLAGPVPGPPDGEGLASALRESRSGLELARLSS